MGHMELCVSEQVKQITKSILKNNAIANLVPYTKRTA